MKTFAIALLAGAAALSVTAQAGAGDSHSTTATAAGMAFAQVDLSSRHRHYRLRNYRVSRVEITPRVFRPRLPLTPLVAAPYVVTYRTYGRAWGPPAPYVATGPNLYAYGPLPYSDKYGYAPVRFAPGVLYDANAINAGVVGYAVPGSW